jgi:hypothetical protein
MRQVFKAFALALLAGPAFAQDGGGRVSAILGPQYVNYKIGTGSAEKTVTQLSVPLVFIMPFGEKFTLDMSTSWADSRVSSGGVESSKISGFTDTQIRGNLSLFDNSAIFTLGVNVPSGMYKVPTGQQEAAGQIGSDFLLYPVSSMGSGTALTGGIAIAKMLGEWQLGLGGSFRYSSPFDAYEVQSDILRFEPGSESRLRVGLDRSFGEAQVSIGGTYSMFTDNKAGATTFATGARTLGQVGVYYPSDYGDWTVSVWNLYRAPGEIIGADAPWENIINGGLSVGFNYGGMLWQPSVEARAWQRDGENAGTVGTGGVRVKWDWGSISVNPSVTYSLGKVYPAGSATSIDVSGLRAQLLFRYR